jgi:hypothetical protein
MLTRPLGRWFSLSFRGGCRASVAVAPLPDRVHDRLQGAFWEVDERLGDLCYPFLRADLSDHSVQQLPRRCRVARPRLGDQPMGNRSNVILGDRLQQRGPQEGGSFDVGVPRPARVAPGESASGGTSVW